MSFAVFELAAEVGVELFGPDDSLITHCDAITHGHRSHDAEPTLFKTDEANRRMRTHRCHLPFVPRSRARGRVVNV